MPSLGGLRTPLDMVEFDVRAWHGELLLAHTIFHCRLPGSVRLEQALAHLSSPRFGTVDLNVDLKRPGCEAFPIQGTANDRIERDFSEHLPGGPVDVLCLHMRWEKFVGMRLEVLLDVDRERVPHAAVSF